MEGYTPDNSRDYNLLIVVLGGDDINTILPFCVKNRFAEYNVPDFFVSLQHQLKIYDYEEITGYIIYVYAFGFNGTKL